MNIHKELKRLGIYVSPEGVPHLSIDEIKVANQRAGSCFFSPETMRFFNSRVSNITYCGGGGIFFVSSERHSYSNGERGKRSYSVREFNPETCDIWTVGEFNNLSKSTAHRTAKALAEGTYRVVLLECGCCGQYHTLHWHGDCREDVNRFAGAEDFAKRKHMPSSCVIEIDLEEQEQE